jgi:AcrR family transcriptional regulator
MDRGYAQFSMRNVAAEAGMHLNNVQYYFRTRRDLVRALMRDTEARYLSAYRQCLDAAPPDRLGRFTAVLDFNLQDTASRETRRFFTQMWALLDTMDGDTGSLLDEFYEMDLAALRERISELDPHSPPQEIHRRATLLAALTEGLILVGGAHSSSGAKAKRLTAQARALGIGIALGRMTTGSNSPARVTRGTSTRPR